MDMRLPTDEEKAATVAVLKDIQAFLKQGRYDLHGHDAQRLVRAQQWCDVMVGQMDKPAVVEEKKPELKVVEPEVVADGQA